jgi:cellulose synthase/poly-beta-1,6-N-acetylglucosamine synthase-like glycosyltransferase
MMIISFMMLWIFSIILYGPRLWQILTSGRSLSEVSLLSSFTIFQLIFWLLSAYFIAVVMFSFISKPVSTPQNFSENKWPEVAILYTTFNDFCVEAASSCLKQDYPNFHLFLVDDSTKEEIRQEVDAFYSFHPEKITIVRRPSRKGFKSGAMNYVLCEVATKYPFFAVIDADEKIPEDFLKRTMVYLNNSELAFVQTNHAPNPEQTAKFACDIGPTILPFWGVHCRVRNRYGFVTYVGHGAVIRRSAWEAVSGFPEVITEDLAFSALLAEKGMRGIFLDNILCYEDFPSNYPAFRRQQERYIMGTTEVMCKYSRNIIQSSRISLTEKIDFFLWCLPLYIPALCLIFVALCTIGFTLAFGKVISPTISIFGHQLNFISIIVLDERFSPLWSWDFQIFSIIGALSPAFACIALGLKGKLSATRLLFLSSVPYLSVMVLSWVGILRYLVTRKTSWPPTGERYISSSNEGIRDQSSLTRKIMFGQVCNHFSMRILEICIGGSLAIASLITLNLSFFAVSCCLLIGVYIDMTGWEGRFPPLVSSICFALIILQMILNMTLLSYSPGLVPLAFSIHF